MTISENIPQYLYHYTSIESLALILQNQTIRFSSLDRMDDLQEKEAKDIKNIGQFIYVSAWTSEEKESIPMWNMYSSLDAGVRIRLCSNPFVVYENTAQELQRVLKVPVKDNTHGNPLRSFIPLSEMFEKGFFSVQALGGVILHEVKYTQDESKLYPSIVDVNEDEFSVKIGEMGRYKNTHWDFQKEWRYILQILPLNLNQNVASIEQSFQTIANKIRLGMEKQPFRYYDMKIDESAFASMEITTSPRLSLGNRVILETLIEKYNPTASLHRSSLEQLV